jgi:hypothetical protein
MGFFVFIVKYLATSGNHENGFIDGKNDGINLGVVKKSSAIPSSLTPFSDGINSTKSHLRHCI